MQTKSELFLMQSLTLFYQFSLLTLVRDAKTSAAYKLDNLLQLVAVEPRAVTFANVNDDAGAAREVDAVHQLIAFRARHIAHLVRLCDLVLRNMRGRTEYT